MTTLRICDDRDGVLALDLRDLIDLLAPRSLQATWTVSPVKLHYTQVNRTIEEFMITGPGRPDEDQLELLAAGGASVSGTRLSQYAHETWQVIWGQFVARLPQQNEPWVMIRAIDGTFYEVTSSDDKVLDAIRSTYRDVRVASGPVTSAPIEPIDQQVTFQTRLHEEVVRLLGDDAASEVVGFERDIKVCCGAYEVWIYEDGANVLGPSVDKRFEACDFDGLDDLRAAVLTFVATLEPGRTK